MSLLNSTNEGAFWLFLDVVMLGSAYRAAAKFRCARAGVFHSIATEF
jgi:hypothetical protein